MEIDLVTLDEWKQECAEYVSQLAHYWLEERFEQCLLKLGDLPANTWRTWIVRLSDCLMLGTCVLLSGRSDRKMQNRARSWRGTSWWPYIPMTPLRVPESSKRAHTNFDSFARGCSWFGCDLLQPVWDSEVL